MTISARRCARDQSAAVRDLVGGRNDAVQAYLETRKEGLEAHHKQYGLTPKQNRKPSNIADEITVE
jgi:regulator of sigma D